MEHSNDGFPRLMYLTELVVSAVAEAISVAASGRIGRKADSVIVAELLEIFRKAFPRAKYLHTGIDRHLVTDLWVTKRGHSAQAFRSVPRLIDLVLLNVDEALSQPQVGSFVLLPSPFHIAIDAITVPSEPQSRAYPLAASKLLLSSRLNVTVRNSFSFGGVPSSASTSNARAVQKGFADVLIDEAVVSEEVSNCRTYFLKDDAWDFFSDRKKIFVANFLSARGVLLHRVHLDRVGKFHLDGPWSQDWRMPLVSTTLPVKRNANERWSFRLSRKFTGLPPPSDFVNEIFGVPIPLRGAENIFFGGLKASVKSGLVVQVTGGPGVGKTSFALALATSLAPLGTATVYLSFEEDADDLRVKLRQQRQQRLQGSSFLSSDDTQWFWPVRRDRATLDEVLNEEIRPLGAQLQQLHSESSLGDETPRTIHPPLPFIVVLDSLSALVLDGPPISDHLLNAPERKGMQRDGFSVGTGNWQGSQSRIRSILTPFIEECRKLNALVILITSQEFEGRPDLDYMVDMAIRMSIEGQTEHEKKPLRLFALTKSRHQISRHGTHVFHLSGDSGFRFAPQLSSQMDALQHYRKLLWDPDVFSQTLNVRRGDGDSFSFVPFLNLNARSQILIQGRGSSGKAGLAMKIAYSQKYRRASGSKFIAIESAANVLIISFLYPEAYYLELRRRLLTSLTKEADVIPTTPNHTNVKGASKALRRSPLAPTVIQLHPGVLAAEDLYSKLTRALEEARLRGRPFTAVIIDGLHNLALQFPGAGESNYLFPIIYGTLSRANLSTITTFTSISLQSSNYSMESATIAGKPDIGKHTKQPRLSSTSSEQETNAAHSRGLETAAGSDAMEESVFRLRTHLPLLHTLVQASDYVLELWRPNQYHLSLGHSKMAGYLLRVQSAVSVDPPRDLIGWQRQELTFCDPES